MASTIFERSGGFSAIRAVVSDFYDRVTDTDILASYFEDMDMPALIDHQTKFIATLMQGPASYSDDVLQRVHSHLRITKSEFDVLEQLLKETLEDHDFSTEDVDIVIQAIRSREHLIVAYLE